ERARRSRLLPLGFPKRVAPASSSERPNVAGPPSRCALGPAATCVAAARLAGGGHRAPVRALLRALCAAKAAAPLPGVRWAGRLAAALVGVAPPAAAAPLQKRCAPKGRAACALPPARRPAAAPSIAGQPNSLVGAASPKAAPIFTRPNWHFLALRDTIARPAIQDCCRPVVQVARESTLNQKFI